jgi:hypothetical protein
MVDSAERGPAFAARLNSVAEAPEPLRGAVTRALTPSDNIRCLLFGPTQRVIGRVFPASLMAILDDEWIVAIGDKGVRAEVHRCRFVATLQAELTEILLYGRLRLDFVEQDRALAVEVYFNTVTGWLYQDALALVLRGIGGGQSVGNDGGDSEPALEGLPIKFRNGLRRYLLAGDNVRKFVHWPAAIEGWWLLFWRERVPQGVLVLTDTQLLLISDEKAWWRSRRSENAKYGYVVTYCPLSRVASIQLTGDKTYSVLDVKLCVGQFCREFKIDFPRERNAAVNTFIKATISSSQIRCR